MSISTYFMLSMSIFITIVLVIFLVLFLVFMFEFIKDVKWYASQSAKDFVRKLNSRRY